LARAEICCPFWHYSRAGKRPVDLYKVQATNPGFEYQTGIEQSPEPGIGDEVARFGREFFGQIPGVANLVGVRESQLNNEGDSLAWKGLEFAGSLATSLPVMIGAGLSGGVGGMAAAGAGLTLDQQIQNERLLEAQKQDAALSGPLGDLPEHPGFGAMVNRAVGIEARDENDTDLMRMARAAGPIVGGVSAGLGGMVGKHAGAASNVLYDLASGAAETATQTVGQGGDVSDNLTAQSIPATLTSLLFNVRGAKGGGDVPTVDARRVPSASVIRRNHRSPPRCVTVPEPGARRVTSCSGAGCPS
jgi:hypothetical protein